MREDLILANLLYNEEYARKTLPFLKRDYFQSLNSKAVYDVIHEFITKYNSLPNKTALEIELDKKSLPGDQHSESVELLRSLNAEEHKLDWLLQNTEKYCQDRALYTAIMQSIQILDGKDSKHTKTAIPSILSDALGVSFDSHIGHNFLDDADARFEYYHRREKKIAFDLDMFNKITRGGLSRKTLNIILAGCVHPDTKIRVRYRKRVLMPQEWCEEEINIGSVQQLLAAGYEVEVDSPDGWVGVNYFIDKGLWEEYILTVEGMEPIRCNENHLFETDEGWKYAKDLCLLDTPTYFLTRNEYKLGVVRRTGNTIPIVDINVEHMNHRYYTGGVSSHNTGVGKTLFMCHNAAANFMAGYNVLYITMEMAEERIAERIDANLLNVTTDELSELPKDVYDKKIARIRDKTKAKLVVKEYPTAAAGPMHFKALIEELKVKKNFVPDIIYIDYLNICASSRLKYGANVNSYTYIKAIAEELRGLAVEYDLPIVSATQTTRSGYSNADLGLEDTSESFGLPATADFMFALISTEELHGLSQIMVKQLKNRYSDPNMDKRFVIGVDKPKMRFYDTEQSSQLDIMDGPVMDKTGFGQRDEEDRSGGFGYKKKPRKATSDFNF